MRSTMQQELNCCKVARVISSLISFTMTSLIHRKLPTMSFVYKGINIDLETDCNSKIRIKTWSIFSFLQRSKAMN